MGVIHLTICADTLKHLALFTVAPSNMELNQLGMEQNRLERHYLTLQTFSLSYHSELLVLLYWL